MGRAGSEFFRPEHGDDQVHEENERDDADDEGIHKFLEAIAGPRIGGAEQEKSDGEGDVNDVRVPRRQHDGEEQETDEGSGNGFFFHKNGQEVQTAGSMK